ncbi:MAG: RND transporter, partial [Gammaproteobacteria bacterium]|nr:RND transporter [Gammaproteobacteria bacterium]
PPDLGRAVSLKVTLLPVPGVVSLPVQAVYGEGRVFLIADGLLSGVEVERVGSTTGEDGTQRLLVRSDALQDGARVLTSQLSNAVTGLRVRVDDASAEQSTGAS